jgi:hypothetical protein
VKFAQQFEMSRFSYSFNIDELKKKKKIENFQKVNPNRNINKDHKSLQKKPLKINFYFNDLKQLMLSF